VSLKTSRWQKYACFAQVFAVPLTRVKDKRQMTLLSGMIIQISSQQERCP
jgi:hypothetical protein